MYTQSFATPEPHRRLEEVLDRLKSFQSPDVAVFRELPVDSKPDLPEMLSEVITLSLGLGTSANSPQSIAQEERLAELCILVARVSFVHPDLLDDVGENFSKADMQTLQDIFSRQVTQQCGVAKDALQSALRTYRNTYTACFDSLAKLSQIKKQMSPAIERLRQDLRTIKRADLQDLINKSFHSSTRGRREPLRSALREAIQAADWRKAITRPFASRRIRQSAKKLLEDEKTLDAFAAVSKEAQDFLAGLRNICNEKLVMAVSEGRKALHFAYSIDILMAHLVEPGAVRFGRDVQDKLCDFLEEFRGEFTSSSSRALGDQAGERD